MEQTPHLAGKGMLMPDEHVEDFGNPSAPGGPHPEVSAFLATQPVARLRLGMIMGAILVSTIVFVSLVPLAKIQIGAYAPFIPTYVMALIIGDLMTAVLLFGQFSFRRRPALLVLANAYVFTASATAAYALMFPGLYAPDGLLGAGPQSTSAMYMFWHAGFPLLVIVYSVLRDRNPMPIAASQPSASAVQAICVSIGATLACVVVFTLFATAGSFYLPTFIEADRTSDLGRFVLVGDWLISLAALVVLASRRPYTQVDLWLAVVMFVWLFDLALSAIVNSGRYDLGWYTGRIFGLTASSLLLIFLLVENGKHYARLVRMSSKLTEANQRLERQTMVDGLTGISNRRSFDAYLDSQVAAAHRHGRKLSLVMIDVDGFKSYNDTYGHPAGDECLKLVAAALRAACRRPADLAARYGGEEFALILPDTDLEGALLTARSALARVSDMQIPHANVALRYVTVSGGVAELGLAAVMSARELTILADNGLLRAKILGRSRVDTGVLPAIGRTSRLRSQRRLTS